MRLEFDDVSFDPDSRQVHRAGEDVHLSVKAFDLLRLLIERRPNVVSKADIHADLWPDTFVSTANLPTLIAEVRDALGDDARNPRFVRTVHRLGYAFSGTVRGGAPAPAGTSPAPRGWLIGDQGRFALLTGENIIGREGSDVIVLHSPTVSRRHARLIVDDGGVTVEDLDSKNGTFVNDARVSSAPLPVSDGDRVRIGSLLMTFRRAGLASSTLSASTSTDGGDPIR